MAASLTHYLFSSEGAGHYDVWPACISAQLLESPKFSCGA